MPVLATSLRVVLLNISRFEEEVRRSPALASRLAYARAWYAHRDENGRWRFGPSKFIGYEGLTAVEYMELSRKGLDGRRTETQLSQWFTEVPPSSELHEELSSPLSAMLAGHGKMPSRKMRISISNDLHDELLGGGRCVQNDAILDLIVAVAETLPPSERETLCRRLSAIGT